MTFNVGDKAVYPSHGVGVIEKIESKSIAGKSCDFYVLQIITSGIRFLVPKENSQRVGLRAVVNEEEINRIREILVTHKKVTQRVWNRRHREFHDKLASGDIYAVAEVLRDLRCLKLIKELSFGEKQMEEKARSLIVTELSASTNQVSTTIEASLNEWLMA